MNLHATCLICSSKSLKKMPQYGSAYLCNCKKCGFVFSQKIPTLIELNQFYDGYGEYDYISVITLSRYNELLNQFEKYRKTNNLLDIGAGTGVFLEQAKLRGWNVYGTEYGNDKVVLCREKGILMQNGVLNPEIYTVDFDVITSFEVIEHINNPSEEIRNISELLRKGGLFYATTPNFNSLSRRYLKNKWQQIFYPEHLSYYTARTLSKLLSLKNIKPIKIKTTGISLTVYKKSRGADISLGNSSSSDDEIIRDKMENNKLLNILKQTVNFMLTLLRLGDTIKIYAVKK